MFSWFFKEFNKGEDIFNKTTKKCGNTGRENRARKKGTPRDGFGGFFFIYLHCFIKLSDDEQ